MSDYEGRYEGNGEDADNYGGGSSPQPRGGSHGGPDDNSDSRSKHGSRDYERASSKSREDKEKGRDKERDRDRDRDRERVKSSDRERSKDRDRDRERDRDRDRDRHHRDRQRDRDRSERRERGRDRDDDDYYRSRDYERRRDHDKDREDRHRRRSRSRSGGRSERRSRSRSRSRSKRSIYSTGSITTQGDRIQWRSNGSKNFTVKVYYKILASQGNVSFLWKSIWRSCVPSKVAFFVWTAALGNILTTANLKKGAHCDGLVLFVQKTWRISGSLIIAL